MHRITKRRPAMMRRLVCLMLVATTLNGCTSLKGAQTCRIVASSESDVDRLNRQIRGRDLWIRFADESTADAARLVARPDTTCFLAQEPWVPGPSLVRATSRRTVPTNSIRLIGASRGREGFLLGMAVGAAAGMLGASLIWHEVLGVLPDEVDGESRPTLVLDIGTVVVCALVGGVVGSARSGWDLYHLSANETTPR